MIEIEKKNLITELQQMQDKINEYSNKYDLEFNLNEDSYNFIGNKRVIRHFTLQAIIPAKVIK